MVPLAIAPEVCPLCGLLPGVWYHADLLLSVRLYVCASVCLCLWLCLWLWLPPPVCASVCVCSRQPSPEDGLLRTHSLDDVFVGGSKVGAPRGGEVTLVHTAKRLSTS